MTISNNPPAVEAFAMAINDLFAEAKNFLDGQPIEDQQQADALGDILTMMKELVRDAEKTRKAEKQPHLDACKAVDKHWKEATSPAELTIAEATKPLTVWRIAEQAKADAEAKALREKAAKAEQEAMRTRQEAQSLDDAEKADETLKTARIANATANKIDRSATGLRTYWDAEVNDYGALLKWIKQNRKDELIVFLESIAQRNIERAKAGTLPGVKAIKRSKAT